MKLKPLLSKTTKPFIVYVLLVFALSIPVYYLVVDAIWQSELDEHHRILAEQTEYELNRLQLTDGELQSHIQLWNRMQTSTEMSPIAPADNFKDSAYIVDQKIRTKGGGMDRFRVFSTVIKVNGKPFRLVAMTNIEETKSTVMVIAAITIFFFIVMVLGLWWLTRRLSRTLWEPFQHTLQQLKNFKLHGKANIEFEQTDTKEFGELNQSLRRLIDHSISVYQSQKEFTENASHELQTPLAILRNKLDILLQSADLTQNQYQIVEEMHHTLTRSARINKNLLLLAKIENQQFDNTEMLYMDARLLQNIELLREHFEQKHTVLSCHIAPNVQVKGNLVLIEILIQNLLLNAIRHTAPGGTVSLRLTEDALEIANSGEAALADHLLFKRFSSLSDHQKGSGLGLSIVQEISKYHHWRSHYQFENQRHVFSIYFEKALLP